MKVVYQPQISGEQNVIVNKISQDCNISYDTASLLFCRGIDSVDKVNRFLNPGKKWFHDPFLLNGVKEAVERINNAVLRQETVLIYGDYDADGVCATSLLYYCLTELGLSPLTLIPERSDGYGLNTELIFNKLPNKKLDLIITVDCGISDYDAIETLKGNDIDVIVTDHHIPPEVLPNTTTINPKISGQNYPFDKLCGAGVAYKLCCALIGENADKYLDFVALATVADSMDLVGENRDLVYEGLKIFNSKNIRVPFSYLLNNSFKKISSQTLAYQIAPKINAGGRMGDAKCALDLFLSTNPKDIYELAIKLTQYNIERQTECENIYASAKEIITKNRLDDYGVIVVASKEWKVGLIGIVASKLVEDYNKPVIVFAYQNESFKGSARSLDAIDIFEVIDNSKDLTLDFGGHSGAAGVSILEENIDEFRIRVSNFVERKLKNKKLEKEIHVDVLCNSMLSLEFASEVELMEPFGVANKKPLFAVKENSILSKPIKEGSPHYAFNTKAVEMLDFNGEHNVYKLSLPTEKTLIFESNVSVFNGKTSLKGYLKKIVSDYENFNELKLHALYNSLNVIKSYENVSLNVEYLSYKDVKIESGVGTLYILNDANNLSKFDTSMVEKYFHEDDSQNCFNKLLFSPLYIPEGYKTVIYLDKPTKFLYSKGKIYCTDLRGDNSIYSLKVDRETFKTCFEIFSSFNGATFNNVVDFVEKHDLKDKNQLIFTYLVFNELGFFNVENGKLIKLNTPKSALTNSSLYCKISNIKG